MSVVERWKSLQQRFRSGSDRLRLNRFSSFPTAILALSVVVFVYILYVCYRQYWMLYALRFPDFDMSHYHQKVWLLSRFKEPFITVRGLHTFGAHASFIDFIFVPFYWIVSTPLILLWGETLVIALAAFLVYLIAKLRLQSTWMALFLSVVFLMYPALHYLNFENYHPVAFAVLFFLMYWYGMETDKKWFTLVSAILFLSVKQNMSAVLVGTAVYWWVFRKKKYAKYYALMGVIYFIVAMFVIMPVLNKTPITEYGGRVSSPLPDLLRGKITMLEYVAKSRSDENAEYFRDLFYPLGLLPILKPLPILLNPLMYFNLTTSWPYAHRIEYHYTSTIIGSIFVSLIDGIALVAFLLSKCRIKRRYVFLAVQVLLVWTVIATNKIDHGYFRFRNLLKPGPKPDEVLVEEIRTVKERLKGKALSVDNLLLPFFADRDYCYMWTNPLKLRYYGAGDFVRIDKYPEYVILRRGRVSHEEKQLLEEHRYEEDFRSRRLVIYKAVEASDMGFAAEFYENEGGIPDEQLVSAEIAASIAAGVSNRIIYVDGYCGVIPRGLALLKRGKNEVRTNTLGFMSNRDRLFSSGLLVMQFAVGRPELTDAEHEVIRQYIANGGRILLFCPAWVWQHYDKKPVSDLPYARIAKQFRINMESAYVDPPLRLPHPFFRVAKPEAVLQGTFSLVDFPPGSGVAPIVVGANGSPAAVTASKEEARIIVWGQNNLLSGKVTSPEMVGEFVGKLVDWLLEPGAQFPVSKKQEPGSRDEPNAEGGILKGTDSDEHE